MLLTAQLRNAFFKKKILLLLLLLAWNWVFVYYVILNSAREMWSYRQWKRAGCCQVLLTELYSAHKSVITLAGITDAVPWAFLCLVCCDCLHCETYINDDEHLLETDGGCVCVATENPLSWNLLLGNFCVKWTYCGFPLHDTVYLTINGPPTTSDHSVSIQNTTIFIFNLMTTQNLNCMIFSYSLPQWSLPLFEVLVKQ
jgi:hypothetical protein